MNNNEKNSHTNNDTTNARACSIAIPKEQSIRHSLRLQENPHFLITAKGSQLGYGTHDKTNTDVSTAITTPLPENLIEKSPHVNENLIKDQTYKHWPEKFNKVVPRSVEKPRGRVCDKQEGKNSKILISNDKSEVITTCKRQSRSTGNREILKNKSNDCQKTSCRISGETKSPKVKEVSCNTVLSSVPRIIPQQAPRHKGQKGKEGILAHCTEKVVKKVKKKQDVHFSKKTSAKADMQEKIELDKQRIKKNIENLKKSYEAKKKYRQKIVEIKNLQTNNARDNNDCINAKNENNGAARTRIFNLKKSIQMDKNFSTSKIESNDVNSAPETQHKNEPKSKASDPTNLNCTKCCIDSTRNTIQSSKDVKICCKKDVSKTAEIESIANLIEPSNCDCNRLKQLLVANKFSSISEDKIMYNANSINYGCYSDQPYRKGPNKQQDYRNYAINADIKLTKLEKDKSTVNDDAKYNLMKTLIHPASEINGSQGLNNNTIKFSLYKHQSKDGLANCKDEKTQDVYKNSGSSNSTVNVETASLSNIVTQLPDNMSKMESYETLNAAKITAYLKHPSSSNTSDKIISNLKTNGYKYSKKYRRFNHKEKNMCCNMARYIEKMVSNEKKYQKHEKKIDPQRENVKIIIDENSPKTSRIRIVNDRSSVSVVCHGSEKTTSPSRRSNNTAAKNTESSGGESSGYKSYHNDLHKRHFDHSDQAKINSTEHQQIEHVTERKFHNTQTILYHNINDDRFESISSPLDDPVNTQFVGIRENIKSHQNLCEEKLKKRDTETKYTLYDTNKYLSAFTNSLDMYLPCEITAYQMKEVNRSKVFQFNNPELEEKDVDNAEMRIGKYLIENSSDSRDELSEEEESSEQLNSARDAKIDKDKVIVLKKPNNAVQRSLEYVVSKRFLDLNNTEGQDSFIHIPTVPAQHKIITSLQDVKHEEIREAFETSRSTTDLTSALAHNKAAERVKSSISDIETGSGNPKLYLMDKKIVMETDSGYKRIKCSKRLKIKNENLYDSNKVYELWANNKSTANSTDNESQTTRRFICAPSDSKRCRTNKFKFNIFKKIKSCKSEKTTHIPLDQLPKPPSSFLESSAPSQSTMLSSTADTDYWESDTVLNLHKGATLLLHTNPGTKTYTDPTHINHSKRNHITASPEENHDHLHLQSNNRASTSHKDTETYLQSSPAHPINEKQLTAPHVLHTAAPPPPSALPPPYPFCCPFVPYMMQYWQNYQQPPPASKLPLPDGDWQPTVRKNGNEPPPPDMVPIPWFPPMSNVHDHPPRAEMNFTTSNNIHAQPPPEWLMMPRGYAPCFPCSNTTESYLRKTDSSVCKDDEPPVEISENKQDEKKKTVSSKLFKIFRRKNRAEMDTLDDDGKKGKYHRSGSEAKLVRKVQVVENEENNTNGQSIWESPDIAGIVTPEEIGRCFRRGFRADGLTLAGDEYVCTRTPSDTTSEQEEIFNFSDHDTPLDFLLALGFSVDEATAAIRDDEVRNRFKAALTEARIWVPHIATTQGTLLYLLAMKAKPKVMRYFLQLVESIVNKRITNAVKLDAYLKILEKVEEGYVSFVTLFGKDKGNEDDEDTAMMEKQRRRIFYTIYKYAEAEAEEVGKPMTNASVDLLQSLATRYRSAIGPHLQLLACYIGEGLLTKDVQLEAALIYLSRLDSTDVRLTDLEKYCGMPVSERRRLEQGVKMLS